MPKKYVQKKNARPNSAKIMGISYGQWTNGQNKCPWTLALTEFFNFLAKKIGLSWACQFFVAFYLGKLKLGLFPCLLTELMVNNQQYDSHVGRFRQVSLECFIVDRSTPCLRGVGVKAWSGKEDTTLLSMADCRVKQLTVSTATRYGIKPRIQGCPRGSVRIGGQKIRYYKKIYIYT